MAIKVLCSDGIIAMPTFTWWVVLFPRIWPTGIYTLFQQITNCNGGEGFIMQTAIRKMGIMHGFKIILIRHPENHHSVTSPLTGFSKITGIHKTLMRIYEINTIHA